MAPIASPRITRGRRISRTMTCCTSLPPPNNASITASGDSRTGPVPSEINASSTTRTTSATVTLNRRRAAPSLASLRLSTLIGASPSLSLRIASYAGLTRVSIHLHKSLFEERWMAGSSPAMAASPAMTRCKNHVALLFWHSHGQSAGMKVGPIDSKAGHGPY